jgi:hypothetical protein
MSAITEIGKYQDGHWIKFRLVPPSVELKPGRAVWITNEGIYESVGLFHRIFRKKIGRRIAYLIEEKKP